MSFHVPEKFRIVTGEFKSSEADGNNGAFTFEFDGKRFFAIASDGMGWEHVSVSAKVIPAWHIMCLVKKMFWDNEDCVLQYHPPESDYVNNSNTCLHLWRPIGVDFPRPPSILVGIK